MSTSSRLTTTCARFEVLDRMGATFACLVGKRLTYNELTV